MKNARLSICLIVGIFNCIACETSSGTQQSADSLGYGIAVEDTITVYSSTSLSTYPIAGSHFVMRTNSTDAGAIRLGVNTTIDGDIICGTGGNPEDVIDMSPGAIISGNVYSALEDMIFPSVAPPQGFVNGGSINRPATDVTISTSGNYQFSTINLTYGNLIINSDVEMYVTGSVVIGNGTSIKITNSGKLTLYVGGSLIVNNDSGIINEQFDARYFHLYGTPLCTNIVLKAKSVFYGAIYAPNANVDIENAADFYGAIVAKSLSLGNGSDFYYDTRLAVPEPATLALFGLGGLLLRRRKK